MCNPNFSVFFWVGLEKRKITKLGYEKYFLQGLHILSTAGADLLVVDCVCVISKQSKQAIIWWYCTGVVVLSTCLFAIPVLVFFLKVGLEKETEITKLGYEKHVCRVTY